MRRQFILLAMVMFAVVACDSGPDPEAARGYADQIDEKMARQCAGGHEAFIRRVPARPADARMISAPLKSIELIPPIFFAPFDEQEFERFLAGYPDDVEQRMTELAVAVKKSAAALQRDYGPGVWKGFCDTLRQMSRSLRSLG